MPYFGDTGTSVIITDGALVNTITLVRTMAIQNALLVSGFISLSGTYAAGGFSDSMAGLPLGTTKSPDMILLSPVAGFIFEWVKSSQKIKIYRQSAATGALTEIANAALPGAIAGVPIAFFAIASKFS